MRRTVSIVVLILALALVVPTLVAAAEERHSGTVIALERAAGTVLIEELTASNGPTPRAVRRTVKLAPDTRIALQAQTPDGYKSVPMSPVDLRPGDFVTVVGSGDGRLMQASALDVVRESSASASPR
jgi:hypothetical protein